MSHDNWMSIFKSDIALEFKTQQFVKSYRFHFITAPDTYVIYIFKFQHFVYQVILNQAPAPDRNPICFILKRIQGIDMALTKRTRE